MTVGLSKERLEDILINAFPDETQRNAIIEAIIQNNKEVEKNIASVASSGIVKGLQKKGVRF